MIRIFSILSLLISSAAVAGSNADASIISLDEIEGGKAARLMKNKGDAMDVQSTFHEDDIKDTGGIPDELSARLVKNRGPITAKIIASGSHSRYCKVDDSSRENCDAQFSLVAWKFAGDEGTVHGSMEEKSPNNDNEVLLKVDVDCMVRKDHEAIVGGVVTHVHKGGGKQKQELLNSRAYIKLEDNSGSNQADRITDLTLGWGDDTDCKSHEFDEFEKVNTMIEMVDPQVNVCSKHGDWEGCLERAKME